MGTETFDEKKIEEICKQIVKLLDSGANFENIHHQVLELVHLIPKFQVDQERLEHLIEHMAHKAKEGIIHLLAENAEFEDEDRKIMIAIQKLTSASNHARHGDHEKIHVEEHIREPALEIIELAKTQEGINTKIKELVARMEKELNTIEAHK